MSLSPLQSGTYQIFNVLYSTQDADLLYPGGVDGAIGGYYNNSDSGRMQWDVEIISGASSPFVSEITIYNQEVGTYAGIPNPSVQTPTGTPVQGDPTYGPQVQWAVGSVGNNGEYAISLLNSPLVWTLGDGIDGTPITLEAIGATGAQANQQWIFVPL